MRITRKPPSASELAKGQLVQKAIAFHFSDGWDVGVVANTENPAKFTKSKFNYNVRYDAKGRDDSTLLGAAELRNWERTRGPARCVDVAGARSGPTAAFFPQTEPQAQRSPPSDTSEFPLGYFNN